MVFLFSNLKSSEDSSLPNVSFLVISFLFLQISKFTVLPTLVFETSFGKVLIVSIFFPSNFKIISPALRPAFAAGLFSPTLATRAPSVVFNSSTSAISFVICCILTPSHPLFVSPYLINWVITFDAALAGIAKPIPIEPDWPGAIIAVLIPITSPSKLNKGPPELPWLIEASVWIKSSYRVKFISLFLAEIIPEVTVPPRPNGFPIATTQSPTRALSEFPNFTGINFLFVSIFKTARSE